MFEGKIFLDVTGIPILKIAFVKRKFALADPVPFTFANLTTKSFILSFFAISSIRFFIFYKASTPLESICCPFVVFVFIKLRLLWRRYFFFFFFFFFLELFSLFFCEGKPDWP